MQIRTQRVKALRWLGSMLIVILVGGYIVRAVDRTLPLLQPTTPVLLLMRPTAALKLAWPSEQAAVGIVGTSILKTHGVQKPTATASTAKLITALSVLHARPLAAGQHGPTVALSAADVALYNTYKAEDGSVVAVKVGERISEYEMLEAMLLPSANNMADSLARWAFGSLHAYITFANSYVRHLGLAHTHVGGDASGFSPNTTSTASDLVRLGELAMRSPVLAHIVGQTTATGIPVVGTVRNTNALLRTSGIVGVKTGNTTQAGGVFIVAAETTVNANPATIVTAVLGAPTLVGAFHISLPLVRSAEASFRPATIIIAGTVVGQYRLPWGGRAAAIASKTLVVDAWDGVVIPVIITLHPVRADAHAGQAVGNLAAAATILAGKHMIALTLKAAPSKASLWWRLVHP